MPSARAISKGLAAGHTPEKPGYWLHICGTGMLMHYDRTHGRFGLAPAEGEIYDDIRDIERVLTYPDAAMHRNVDKVVLGTNEATKGAVRTLIVSPPCIYGPGRGPGNKRSIQVNRLAAYAVLQGAAPIHAPGLTEWDHAHVRDVTAFWVLAVEAALDPEKNANDEIYGKHGYFFIESGQTHRWSDVSRWIAESAARQGFIPQPRTVETDLKFFGMNARSVGSRARKYLGWKPTAPGLKEEIDGIVAGEVEALKGQGRGR